jgi:hypothetical protein
MAINRATRRAGSVLDVNGTIFTTGLLVNGTNPTFSIREGSAPTATANFGKVFVNSTNSRLYFQDDAGVNYNLTNGATAVTPGGSNTQFQFNNSGTLGGNGALTFITGTRTLAVAANAPLDINSTTVSIADNNIDFDSGSGVTFTPTAGQSLNVALATTGDFNVNSGQLYVDTSLADVGINTTAPVQELDVNGDVYVRNTIVFDTEFNVGNSGTTATITWNNGNKQRITMTGNATLTFVAPPGPTNVLIKIIQDATGSRTITWPGTVRWPSGIAPTLTTTAAGVDILTCYYDGSLYYCQAGLDFR